MERGRAALKPSTDSGKPGRAGRKASRPSEDYWLRALAQISPVGIFRADARGRCVYVNERWQELTGLTEEEALGSGWERALHPEDVLAVSAEWHRACLAGERFKLEYRYLLPEGRVIWILGQAMEERDNKGKVVGYVGTSTDITELRKMREELQASHANLEQRIRERTAQMEQMAMIVADSVDAIVSSDVTGRIMSWNAAAERIFGYSAEEMIGRTSEVVTPADRLEEARLLKQRVRAGERIVGWETVRVARSGELIEVAISLSALRDFAGEIIGTSAIVRDIGPAKKAERRLRQVSGRLLRVQDEERRRLARELHDATAQSLAALSVNLSLLNQPGDTLSAERRAVLQADSEALADSIGRDLRTHAYLLHPPLLDERGLPPALRWLVEGFATRSGIRATLHLDADMERLPPVVELTIFRVVQESLSNVHRHSESPSVEVRLKRSRKTVTLEVRDQGCGFSSDGGNPVGVGIAGMRERLAQVGGVFTVESPGAGTAIRAQIPLR